MRPDFLEMARTWLVRAQGHARPEHEKSLADALEKAWELGIANAIETAYAFRTDDDPEREKVDERVLDAVRALTDRPTDPRGN